MSLLFMPLDMMTEILYLIKISARCKLCICDSPNYANYKTCPTLITKLNYANYITIIKFTLIKLRIKFSYAN